MNFEGRKHVQSRLIEPASHNLNTGDCFILIAPENLYLYLGKYANCIEKAKAKEFASYVLNHRDLGCKEARRIVFIDGEQDAALDSYRGFWHLLNGTADDIQGIQKI